MTDDKDSAYVKEAKARERAGIPPPSAAGDQGWQLGCVASIALAAFVIWLFLREPSPADLRRSEAVQAQIDREREVAEIRKSNARIACDSGVESACVEYAEMID
jgi:hypothetical protein